MKICPHCQKENAKDSRFCGFCGASLEQAAIPPLAESEPVIKAETKTPDRTATEAFAAAEQATEPAEPASIEAFSTEISSSPMITPKKEVPPESGMSEPSGVPLSAGMPVPPPAQSVPAAYAQPQTPPYVSAPRTYAQPPTPPYISAPSQPSYGQPPVYPAQQHGIYPTPVMHKPQGGLAITAFILSLLGLFCCALGLFNIIMYLGIAFTIAAWATMRPYKGKGLAIASIVLSVLALFASISVTAEWFEDDYDYSGDRSYYGYYDYDYDYDDDYDDLFRGGDYNL